MDATLNQEVELGALVCKKLKVIYFNETPWVSCYRDVADKFTALKAIARKFYINKSNIEIINELLKYNDQDILDAFEQG